MNSAQLERECRVFTRHLLGTTCGPYVVRKYIEAHELSPLFTNANRFDALLLRLANAGSLAAKLVDGYACIFAPRSLVRRKLVLLLAILESCAPTSDVIDSVEQGSVPVLGARLAVRGVIAVLGVLAAALFLLPAQLVLRRAKPRPAALGADETATGVAGAEVGVE